MRPVRRADSLANLTRQSETGCPWRTSWFPRDVGAPCDRGTPFSVRRGLREQRGLRPLRVAFVATIKRALCVRALRPSRHIGLCNCMSSFARLLSIKSSLLYVRLHLFNKISLPRLFPRIREGFYAETSLVPVPRIVHFVYLQNPSSIFLCIL